MDRPPVVPTAAFDLSGRTALVTGAGSVGEGVGIGRACAVLLGDFGAHVAVLDANAAAAEETLAMIRGRGASGEVVSADVTDSNAIAAGLQSLHARTGRLDIVVNNVGIVGPRGNATTLDEDAWDHALRVNVTSMMTVCRHAIPLMTEHGGSIVNIGSISGILGGYPNLSYATTKGAINNMTRALAGQHGKDGIRVNCVAPGQLYTPRIAQRGLTAEMRARRTSSAPLATEGTGWDAAYAVLYLASDAARWVTGVVLPVDAGMSAVLPLDSPSPHS